MKVLFGIVAALAVAASADLQVLQQPQDLGVGVWRDTGVPVPKNRIINVNVALKRVNQPQISSTLEDVSNPKSANFREWMSFETARTLIAPSQAGVAAVRKWLHDGAISFTESDNSDQFTFRVSVGKAEEFFRTYFHFVQNNRTGQKWHHASTVHAPAEVVEHISAVFGLHGLPTSPRPITRRPLHKRNLKQDPPNIGPGDLRTTYSVGNVRGSGSTAVRQAVAEFQGQFANTDDLTAFFQNLVPYAKPGDDKVYKYVGDNESGDGIEALLDIQYIMGVAPGVKTEFWGWANFDFCSDLKNWTSTILSTSNPPVVFSVSYGWQGDLGQIGCTQSEVSAIDADFQTISTRGISIIFASGDSGSGSDGSKLWPSWPASSPFVTAVGSTTFTGSVGSQEQATTQFGSGSGFSTMFTRPNFQSRAVQQYLASQQGQLPPTSMWPQNGRATADVSALGEGFQVYVDGSVEIVGGTSAAAPTFSAIISLVNDALAQKGKKPLGYLNPWLYDNPSAFTDITLGSDKIDRQGDPLTYGFNSAPGWDPPTGLGTPIYDKLVSAAGAN